MATGVRLTMSVALAAVVRRTPTNQVTKWTARNAAAGSARRSGGSRRS